MDLCDKCSFSSTDGLWQLTEEESQGVAWVKLEPSPAVTGLRDRVSAQKKDGGKERHKGKCREWERGG